MTPKQLEDVIASANLLTRIYGSELKLVRQERNQSLRKAAEDIGIDHVTLTRIEHGDMLPNVAHIAMIELWMTRGAALP